MKYLFTNNAFHADQADHPGSGRTFALCWTLIALLISGCGKPYEKPQKSAQEMPNALEPVEIDLGQFDFTIPNAKTNSTILVDFHAFVKLPRYKSYELTPVLESHASRFRHDVLLRVRKLTRTALNDPDLAQVRAELRASLDALLSENKIQQVGFYHFRFLEE